MKLNYSKAELLAALDIWPNVHGFHSGCFVPVETWTATGWLGVVFYPAPNTRAEVMRDLRRRYRRHLLGARLFDDKRTVLYLKAGHTFPRRLTRAEVIERTT